jgi:short-subunit dehydrogenase
MTTLTKEHHRKPYPAISPSSSLNSHSGHTILITGSSSGIGLEVAKAFITASASLVIILGRRQELLSIAVEELKAYLPAKSETKVFARKCDIGNGEEMEKLWGELKREGIEVDVMVLNAAKTGPMTVNSDWKKVWEFYEVNVLANLRMTEKFLAQGPEMGKVSGHAHHSQ